MLNINADQLPAQCPPLPTAVHQHEATIQTPKEDGACFETKIHVVLVRQGKPIIKSLLNKLHSISSGRCAGHDEMDLALPLLSSIPAY